MLLDRNHDLNGQGKGLGKFGEFYMVPALDAAIVFCAWLLWMIYHKRHDSERYYITQAQKKKQRREKAKRTRQSEIEVSVSAPSTPKQSTEFAPELSVEDIEQPIGGAYD